MNWIIRKTSFFKNIPLGKQTTSLWCWEAMHVHVQCWFSDVLGWTEWEAHRDIFWQNSRCWFDIYFNGCTIQDVLYKDGKLSITFSVYWTILGNNYKKTIGNWSGNIIKVEIVLYYYYITGTVFGWFSIVVNALFDQKTNRKWQTNIDRLKEIFDCTKGF